MALPVCAGRGEALLGRAAACVLAQSHAELELLIVLNGAGPRGEAVAAELARQDERVRVVRLERAGLARALNAALREACHDLLARMDADDRCHPGRLAAQVRYLERSPRIVALGTAFEREGPDGAPLGTVRPPCAPARLRWALLLDNCFCHGSMVLRRRAILDAGGYDESLERGQDYDLWLRLSRAHELANLPDALYTHTVAEGARPGEPCAEQARVVGARMLSAWRGLPTAWRGDDGGLAELAARAHAGGHEAAEAADLIARQLDERGPALAGLMAYLHARQRIGVAPGPVYEACRWAKVREVAARLRAAGVTRVWLYGAGEHSALLARRADELRLELAGLIEDGGSGLRFGLPVVEPAGVSVGAEVLLSSDWHEPELWRRSAAMRARGVRVWGLYTEGDGSGGAAG